MSLIICKSSALLFFPVMILIGCGAGEISRNDLAVAKPVQQSNTQSRNNLLSGRLSSDQQAKLKESINKITSNSLTKDFSITVSYPYVITGNLKQAKLEYWKSRIQRTQRAIKFMYFTQDPTEVVQIWLFKDAESYFQYNLSLWNASPGTGFGYYLPKQKRMMMNIASGGGTLTHELVHPYIEVNFPNSPLWFNEGLASLYEQSSYRGGKVFGETNWRLRGLQTVINANAMPSLKEMMQTNRGQFLGPNRQVYYAQARYLMYYLQSRGLLERYYRQFSSVASVDPTGIKTLLEISNINSMARLERDWVRFVKGLRF